MKEQGKFLPLNAVTGCWEDSLALLSVATSVSRDLAKMLFHLHYNRAEDGVPHGVNGEPVDLNGWKVVDPEVTGPMKECRDLHMWFCDIHRDIADAKYKSAMEKFSTLQSAIAEAVKRFQADRDARAQRFEDNIRAMIAKANDADAQ
jgi:hypothetical protein